jgi:CcmD family protein
MRRFSIALLALFALAAAPAVHAQAPAGEAASSTAPVSAPAAGVQSAPAANAPSSASSLPRYTPPRTMRAYAHVFVAYAVAWLLLVGYMVFLSRKFKRVEEQVAALARS